MIKKQTFTSLSFFAGGFSVAQGTGATLAEAIHFVQLTNTAGLNDEQIAKAIFLKLKECGGLKSHLSVVLPRRKFILKNLLLPAQNDQELKKMIALQLSTHMPYKEEEAVWDYVVLETRSDGYKHVLLMMVSLDVVEGYLKYFLKNKIRITTLTLSSWGLVGWLAMTQKSLNITPLETLVVIRWQSDFVEVCLCNTTKFFFSRQFENESYEEVLSQMKLTLVSYQNEKMGPLPSRGFVLSAESLLPKAIQDQLREVLGCSFAFHDATEAIPLSASNFLPLYFREAQDLKSRILRKFQMVFLMIAAVISLVLVCNVGLIKKNKAVHQLDEKINEMQPLVKAAEVRSKQREAIRERVVGRVPAVEVLGELSRITPPGVFFSSFHLESSGAVTLQGQSANEMTVNQLQANLINSSIFKNVTLQHAAKRTTIFGEVTQFLITAVVKSGATR